MTLVHSGGATGPQRYYRLQQVDPLFALKTSSGAITSLQRTADSFPTEYISGGKRLGDVVIKYRQSSDPAWHTVQTATLSGVAAAAYSTSADGTQYIAQYQITNGLSGTLVFETIFTFKQDTLFWTLNATNLTGQQVVIGGLALPVPREVA